MLVLFDIDGTLLRRLPAGETGRKRSIKEEAFMRTVKQLWSVDGGFYTSVIGTNLEGMTDMAIMVRLAGGMGVDTGQVRCRIEEVKMVLIEEFEKLVKKHAPAHEYVVLPGTEDLLGELKARKTKLGLATGNLEYFARYKLKLMKLDQYFALGAFGDHSFDRGEIVKKVLEEGAEEKSFLVGDTPADIEAAQSCGIGAIAVATGGYTSEELAVCSPELLVESLTEKDRILEYLGF